jgi:hypothetical protein
MFAIPYAYFALVSNPDSCVEIILEDLEYFTERYAEGIASLESLYPGRSVFRQSRTVASGVICKPHVIRFIEEPVTKSKFVYIGDIDVMIFEDIYKIHKKYMDDNGLPFSNIIRPGTESTPYPRLTGLHFCPTNIMYPLPDIVDLDLNARNDENILYEIMNRKNSMVPLTFRNRPICGIHISVNRDATGRYSVNRGDEYLVGQTFNWGIKKYQDRFLKVSRSKSYSEIYFSFGLDYRALLMAIESVIKKEESKLHRVATNFLVDKRLIASIKVGKRADLIIEAKSLLDKNDTKGALNLLHNVLCIWPSDFNIYYMLTGVYLTLSENDIAHECLIHAEELAMSLTQKKLVNKLKEKSLSQFEISALIIDDASDE